MTEFLRLGSEPTGHALLKPWSPGRRKYVQSKGRTSELSIPSAAGYVVKSCELLMIAEGVQRALASIRANVPCSGLNGGWNWQAGRTAEYDEPHRRRLAPTLSVTSHHRPWSGRHNLPALSPRARRTVPDWFPAQFTCCRRPYSTVRVAKLLLKSVLHGHNSA